MTPSPDESTVRPFGTFLLEQAQGRSHDELSDNLHELIARVRETGKKGSLTYTVTVSPLDKEVYSLKVEDSINLKLPEHDRPTSIFYPDAEGNLSRRDPRQMSFDDLAVLPEPEGLAPFEGGTPFKVLARLRFSIDEGGLRLKYVLDRPAEHVRIAFDEVVALIGAGVDAPVFHGRSA